MASTHVHPSRIYILCVRARLLLPDLSYNVWYTLGSRRTESSRERRASTRKEKKKWEDMFSLMSEEEEEYLQLCVCFALHHMGCLNSTVTKLATGGLLLLLLQFQARETTRERVKQSLHLHFSSLSELLYLGLILIFLPTRYPPSAPAIQCNVQVCHGRASSSSTAKRRHDREREKGAISDRESWQNYITRNWETFKVEPT